MFGSLVTPQPCLYHCDQDQDCVIALGPNGGDTILLCHTRRSSGMHYVVFFVIL
jgi:hypothetical protein